MRLLHPVGQALSDRDPIMDAAQGMSYKLRSVLQQIHSALTAGGGEVMQGIQVQMASDRYNNPDVTGIM